MSTTERKIGRYLVPVLAVMAFQVLWAGLTAAGHSNSKPSRKPTAKSAAPATPVVKSVSAPKSKITISLSHRLRRGTLLVSLDDTPILHEEFTKAMLAISQTTKWDPIEAAVGKHKLTARVKGKNGKTYFSRAYEFELSRTKGAEIRIRMKGDKLTFDRIS